MDEKEKPSYHGHRERIKNKFSMAGLEAFADHEVLELLLSYSIPRRDVKPIAWELLKKFKRLSCVFDADEKDLLEVKGIGKSSAVFLGVVRAAFKRYALDNIQYSTTIKSPQDVAEYCRASLEGKEEEIFEVIYLTVRSTVIGTEILAVGVIDRASVSARKVVQCALAAKAASIVLTHNHPSGDPKPSAEDVAFTAEVIKAASVFDISVLDHIIVGRGGHYSMRSKGLI